MNKRQHAVQFSTVAKVLLVSLFLGGSGVGYVLQKSQIRSLRAERSKNEEIIRQLIDEQRRVDVELSKTTQPSEINALLSDHGIAMQELNLRTLVILKESTTAAKRAPMTIAQK